jgi:uncharacterized membrane protein YjgN (DUF898 family)
MSASQESSPPVPSAHSSELLRHGDWPLRFDGRCSEYLALSLREFLLRFTLPSPSACAAIVARRQYLATHTWLAASPFCYAASVQALRSEHRKWVIASTLCVLLWWAEPWLRTLVVLGCVFALPLVLVQRFTLLATQLSYRGESLRFLPKTGALLRAVYWHPLWLVPLAAAACGALQCEPRGKLTILAVGFVTCTLAVSWLRRVRRFVAEGLAYGPHRVTLGGPNWDLVAEWCVAVLLPTVGGLWVPEAVYLSAIRPGAALNWWMVGPLLAYPVAVALLLSAWRSNRWLGNLRCGPLSLRPKLKTFEWLGLRLQVFVLTVLSLGALGSWGQMRLWRHRCQRLRVLIEDHAPSEPAPRTSRQLRAG